MSEDYSPGVKILHAGLEDAEQGQPFTDGPVFASTFHLAGDPGGVPYQYGRFGNPTWSALEATIGALEGGAVVVFPSGTAASAAVMSILIPGDVLVLPSDSYYGTRAYAETYLVKMGVELRLVPTIDMAAADYSGVRMVWLETPTNPGLDVCDIAAVSENAHGADALVTVDNTTATALGQKPLELGADFSIASDTKAFNGHSDVVYGHVAVKDPELIVPIRQWRTLAGGIPGPMETWLVQRGLATLDLRLERQSRSARKIAEFLKDHDVVRSLRYPGLPTDPSYEIAGRQMRSAGFLVGMELENAEAAQAFLSKTRLIFEATSFGGVHSSAERRARWGSDDVSEGFIRLSIGCEPVDDLLQDISAALSAV